MNDFELVAEQRAELGKGAMRRLRRTGRVPAVVYGAEKDPVNISLASNVLARQLEHEAFYSHILNLRIGDTVERVILRDMQRHPARGNVLHLDLQRVDEKRKLHMNVPLHFVNEERAPGVKLGGGVVSHLLSEVEITCLPGDLPEFIEVDLGTAELNTTVHLSDLVLPDGVEIPALAHGPEADQPVVTIALPRGGAEEAGEEGEAAEGEEAGAAPAGDEG